MESSEIQRENCPNILDNTHGGNNIVNVVNVTKNENIIKHGKHINNTHGGLHETPVNSVRMTLEEELFGNTSSYSNIFQGDGADTISDKEDSDDDIDDFETSSVTSASNIDIDDIGNISEITSLAEDNYDEADNDIDVDDQDGETEEEDDDNNEYNIPVNINTNRPRNNSIETRARVLTTVNIVNQRTEASMALPAVGVTNFRSLQPKVNNVALDMMERELDIVIGSETWHKDSNKTLKANIEKLLEEHGLAFISCPRPSTKRGGGSAVLVNTRKFTVEKLAVLVPHKLEVAWCLVRPKEVNKDTNFKEIIVSSFYSAPNYRKNSKLIQHLIDQMHMLLAKYPKAGFLCGGDRNKMDTQPIEDALPRCKQIVTKYTYKNRKVHDIILTNMSHLYALPFVVPAVCPDVRGKGVPSDHDMAVALPLAGAGAGAVTREYNSRTSRPMPESAVRQFGQWITSESWSALRNITSPSQQGVILQSILQ